jgi:hypothetical protein
MPAAEEKSIRASAKKAGLKAGSEKWKAYLYGTLALIKKRRAEKNK